ncbi:MAG TPA: tetratricopeptide repeat protein [Chitinophagaceae bacterium]|jgi:tetratricopeptide (TPR) repeat protein|nr:tetratricopeptide repeat protein [Chitinophagaceae bacterium]
MDVILDQAKLLLDQGRPKDAEVKIKQFLQQEPNNDYALSLLARCLYERKQYDEGIKVIQDAISFAPQQSFYFYLLAFGFYQKENSFLAIDNLNKAIGLNPYHAEYYGLLSFVLLGDKNFKDALAKANEGLAIEAENITCLNARAMALNKLKKTDEAIATMQHALAQDPDSEFTHTTIGWNLLERGRHNEAAKHFREALRINPVLLNAQSGLKEALKSKIPPYKWLLQYSFWVNNQGKKLKRAMPIILYVAFRLLILIFRQNSATESLAWIAGGVYLLFVIASWTMNSIANFFLLFHPDGKYALSNTEKWSAITVVTAMLSGFIVLSLSLFTSIGRGTDYEFAILAAGLVCLSLALPLGEMDYPIRFKKTNKRNLFSLTLAGLGLLSLLFAAFFPAQSLVVMVVYGIAFILYNWSGALRRK